MNWEIQIKLVFLFWTIPFSHLLVVKRFVSFQVTRGLVVQTRHVITMIRKQHSVACSFTVVAWVMQTGSLPAKNVKLPVQNFPPGWSWPPTGRGYWPDRNRIEKWLRTRPNPNPNRSQSKCSIVCGELHSITQIISVSDLQLPSPTTLSSVISCYNLGS